MIYLEVYVVIITFMLVLCLKEDMVFKKYKTVDNKKKMSGFELTRDILDDNKLEKVYVIERKEKIMDVYDYRKKTVRLSSEVFHENSIYALAKGAYVGMHGAYDKKNNSLYKFVEIFKPIRFGSYMLSLLSIVLGMFNGNEAAYQLALILLFLALIFSVLDFIVKKKIAYDTYDYLEKKKYFETDEDDAVSDVLQNVYLESFTWLIHSLVNGIVNTFNESKKK